MTYIKHESHKTWHITGIQQYKPSWRHNLLLSFFTSPLSDSTLTLTSSCASTLSLNAVISLDCGIPYVGEIGIFEVHLLQPKIASLEPHWRHYRNMFRHGLQQAMAAMAHLCLFNSDIPIGRSYTSFISSRRCASVLSAPVTSRVFCHCKIPRSSAVPTTA